MQAHVESLEPRTLLSGWTTVDDYRYTGSPGTGTYSPGSWAQALAVDATGQVYAGGFGRDTNSFHLLVKRSSDSGTTWSTPTDDNQAAFAQMSDMAVSPSGAVFTAGFAGTLSSYRWLVRRSTDGGTTWSTVDSFSLGGTSAAKGITTDAAGNIYAVGFSQAAGATTSTWIVRRSTDGGTTWSTVDSLTGVDGGANGVFVHPTAGIFVAGMTATGGKKGGLPVWVIRRSTDGGNTWATVDGYQLNKAFEAAACGIGMDAAGNLYAVGNAGTTGRAGYASYHWIVRESANAGSTWATVDDFQLQGADTRANRFAKDSSGNLYVVGQARVNYSNHWLVRSHPNGTGAWGTADDYQLSTGQNHDSDALAVVADGFGHVFTAGVGTAADGTQHWIVRSFSSASAAMAATFSTTSIGFGPSDSTDDDRSLPDELATILA